ncbi:MAG: ferrochelatase [Hydrogenophilales bacterium]|nr:ferrochelatase [Hydrogenophilales bacterium]
MTYFLPEPAFKHDQPLRIGILLINLGTPEAPTAGAVRPYLKEFLSDRRVVEIPRAVWWPILNGVILNTRPKQSAEKYASIWQPEGSPLKMHTEQLSRFLVEELRQRSPYPLQVEYAMRYGQPNVAGALGRLKAQGCDRILVLPLYPQYAASSAGTALDAVFRILLHTRNVPDIRTVRHFHDHPGYIDALKQSIERYWAEHDRADILLMSFHGVPRYTLDKGDPYHCECHKTGRLLAEALNLKPEQYRLTFQSRFGKAEWLKPYTAATLEELGRAKTGRLDVICPGFVADCLETLEEIAMEGKATFLNAGGGDFRYIPALNSRPAWVSALADIVIEQLSGWLPDAWSQESEERQLRERHQRAQNMSK